MNRDTVRVKIKIPPPGPSAQRWGEFHRRYAARSTYHEGFIWDRSQPAIGPFCTDVRQFQLLRYAPPDRIRGVQLRAGSDLESGYTDVAVTAAGTRTRVRIDALAKPARRLPSFLPTRWVLNALRRQAVQSGEGLERLAARGGGASAGR